MYKTLNESEILKIDNNFIDALAKKYCSLEEEFFNNDTIDINLAIKIYISLIYTSHRKDEANSVMIKLLKKSNKLIFRNKIIDYNSIYNLFNDIKHIDFKCYNTVDILKMKAENMETEEMAYMVEQLSETITDQLYEIYSDEQNISIEETAETILEERNLEYTAENMNQIYEELLNNTLDPETFSEIVKETDAINDYICDYIGEIVLLSFDTKKIKVNTIIQKILMNNCEYIDEPIVQSDKRTYILITNEFEYLNLSLLLIINIMLL